MGESSGEMQEQQRQRAVQTTGRGERRPQCKRQRAGRLRSPGDDEWQSGGQVARGEGYIGQAKLMGLGEEIRNKFGKGLEYLFLIYLFIGLAKIFTSAKCYGKTSMNFLAKTIFLRGSNVIRPK